MTTPFLETRGLSELANELCGSLLWMQNTHGTSWIDSSPKFWGMGGLELQNGNLLAWLARFKPYIGWLALGAGDLAQCLAKKGPGDDPWLGLFWYVIATCHCQIVKRNKSRYLWNPTYIDQAYRDVCVPQQLCLSKKSLLKAPPWKWVRLATTNSCTYWWFRSCRT